jgi:hypothetical protein
MALISAASAAPSNSKVAPITVTTNLERVVLSFDPRLTAGAGTSLVRPKKLSSLVLAKLRRDIAMTFEHIHDLKHAIEVWK